MKVSAKETINKYEVRRFFFFFFAFVVPLRGVALIVS